MIKARHTQTGRWLSNFCSGRLMNRYFREINISGDPYDSENRSILMMANHFSWWDGFIQYRLNKAVYKRKLHVMMLEEQLRLHMIMNRCGCFSIRKNSRSILETMRYTIDLMSSPGNMVLIFPQGEITTMHTHHITFEAGADYLLKNIPNDYRIVFNVNLTDYGSFKKPSLNIYFKTLNPQNFDLKGDLEQSYNDYYRECLKSQSHQLWK